ncbi:thermonuclease family protein [Glutamicibacter protophormiae]|uniref:thermonuclease family protein n=1 Tax=Glutamicibacter protophormiae TaxID=37930 RepID=UPI002A8233F5|nr:thermonuclease family protein [Glutamicibacter protophormiae]WPR66210.1 thermonuclease family protein [Glutamicibacter protophormiae]WPR69706.1 thermonuclease family protein [Glutamicibacter protophormiae]
MSKRAGWISAGVVASLVAGGAVYATTSNSDSHGTVIRVVDGDTVDLQIAGEETRVRLLNIDTPETVDPDKAVECMGPEATDYLSSLLRPGEKVDLEYDVEREDRYGRTLAGVFKDDLFVNSAIAAAGLGVAVKYAPNVKFYDEVLAAEQQAADAGEGLFSPAVDCTIPAQLDEADTALSEVSALPADSIEEAESLMGEAAAAVGVGLAVKSALGKAKAATHPVTYALLNGRYASDVSRLSTRIDDTRRLEAVHKEQRAELVEKEKQRKEAERKKKEAEAKAKKAAEAEKKAEAAAQRAAEQRAAAKAAQKAQQKRYSAPKSTPRTQPKKSAPKTNSYSNYTGPRCYAPGGKTWKPC